MDKLIEGPVKTSKEKGLSAKLAKSPETSVLSNTEVPVAPVKEQATPIAN